MIKASYSQKFRSEWTKHPCLKSWIRQDITDERRAYCSYCKISLVAKLWDLVAHSKTKKHKTMSGQLVVQSKIPFKPKSLKAAEQEASLALYIAQHSSIAPVDHLSEMCKNKFNDAIEIKLHRTKCTNIIRNVLAPHFFEELRMDVGDSKFSLLLDETTDINVTKLLGIAIIYFSNKHNQIISTFLSIAELENADSSSIVRCLKLELEKFKLDINKLIGIGTDNASVMVGCNKSVYTELKREVPSLILVKCVCHSIQLAINHASKECLPDTIEFLIYETYNWFSKSSSRKLQYKKMFQLINDDNAPLKIPRVSDTRWLSIEGTVSRILQQWLELRTHFEITGRSEKCHKAKILYELYKDERNYLYLLFLKPILTDLLHLNNSFQSNNVDPTKLLKDFEVVINSLKSKIISPDNDIDIISMDFEEHISENCYLGYSFENKILEMKNSAELSTESENILRRKCTNFVVVLINELKQRLPDNFDIIKKVNMFSVGNVLRTTHEDIVDVLKHFNYKPDIIDKIINQYNRINFVKWNNINNTTQFWAEVHKYTDAGGNKVFSDLAEFALHLLSLPWSNADVERLFSQVNLVKTKLRSSIHLITMNAILSIRYGLKKCNKCCSDYEIPRKYLKLIGTNKAYESTSIDYTNNDSEHILYEIITEIQ